MTIAGPTLEKRTSGSPKVALSAAIVRSHSMTSSQPPPSTWPCTAAITGFFMVHGAISNSSWTRRCCMRLGRVAAPVVRRPAPSPRCRSRRRSCGLRRAAGRRLSPRSSSARANASSQLPAAAPRLMALSFSGRFKRDDADLFVASYRTTDRPSIRSPPLNRIARQPVDRREPLANAADHRNARRAKIRNLLPVHDARPGVQADNAASRYCSAARTNSSR